MSNSKGEVYRENTTFKM